MRVSGAWLALLTAKDSESSSAGSKPELPAWEAMMVQVPAPTIDTAAPVAPPSTVSSPPTEQTEGVVVLKLARRPDEVVAEMEKGVSSRFLAGMGDGDRVTVWAPRSICTVSSMEM